LPITVAVGVPWVLFPKPYDYPTRSYRQHAGEQFTLSRGRGQGEGEPTSDCIRVSRPL